MDLTISRLKRLGKKWDKFVQATKHIEIVHLAPLVLDRTAESVLL